MSLFTEHFTALQSAVFRQYLYALHSPLLGHFDHDLEASR